MNSEEQLVITGRVIDAARKIESRLVERGASGSGLREKVDSLTPALPDEVVRLIHFIGAIRNRVAHESGTTLRQDELELFEEAAQTVLDELDKLRTEPSAASESGNAPQELPAASPDSAPLPVSEESVRRSGKTRQEENSSAKRESLLPSWNSPMWAALPGLHLVYAFGAAWDAFGAGQLYLLLTLAELVALTALGFAAAIGSLPLAAAGGTLFLAIYFCGIWLGLRNPSAEEERAWYCLIPFANFLFFVKKIAAFIEPARLVIAIAVLGIWLAAIQLAVFGEFPAAGIAAFVSWIGALADSLLRR